MTRKLAGYSFQALLHLVSVTLQLPHREEKNASWKKNGI
jgi:hypothetical protein